MHLRDCDRSHADAILSILNDAIACSTAIYDYAPRPPAAMAGWFDAKERGGFPVIGAFDDGAPGGLIGFASYGTFRAWPAYKFTVEHSLYVHAAHRGRGVGRALLRAIVDRAEAQQLHALIGGIDSSNAASLALHRSLGFAHVGTLREVGFKFGRWLDLCFYQRTLSTPATPTDG